jgi:hypothetical protein
MTTKGIRLRTIGRTLYMACVLGLVANIGAAAWHIAWPESAPRVMAANLQQDEPAYRTGAFKSWSGSLPRARTVRIVDRILVDGQAAPEDGVWAGQFDPVSGEIEVIRSAGDITLAHEYGHALLQDLIVAHMGAGAPALSVFDDLASVDRAADSEDVPEWLRPVFNEYRALPDDPYGDAYYGSSFNEYFAESFAWAVERDGFGVAPATAAFLADLESPSR